MSPFGSKAKAKGPSLSIILGSKHTPEEEHEDGDGGDGKHDAAEALIDAVHAKNADGVVEAMHALYELCADEGGEDDKEGEEY